MEPGNNQAGQLAETNPFADIISEMSVTKKGAWKPLTLEQMISANWEASVDDFERSFLYLQIVIVISIFYALFPLQAIVLVLSDAAKARHQDSCYYNFSCLRPIGELLP